MGNLHVLGIVGSMRKDRLTHALVRQVIDGMAECAPSVTRTVVHIADYTMAPCRVVCSRYCSQHAYQCCIRDDVDGILQQMQDADVLVIGTPLYFRGPPAQFQAFAERLISRFFFYESQGGEVSSPLAGKVCGLVGVTEYSNPQQVLEYLHDFCMVLKMQPVSLAHFPYLGVGGQSDTRADDVFSPDARARELAAVLLAAVRE